MLTHRRTHTHHSKTDPTETTTQAWLPQSSKTTTTTTHLPSRGHPTRSSSFSVFFRLGGIRLSDIRLRNIRLRGIRLGGRRSSRLRRPRQMTQTDIPKMQRHKDGGLIRLNFPSQGHPSVPFVSAIRLGDIPLLQFNTINIP